MVPANIHDFFLTSGSAAGALIGLLFVAISVSANRLAGAADGAYVHRLRAAAALTAFINALTVSLFALVPAHKVGPAALGVAIAGLLFVTAALLSLIRLRQVRWRPIRESLFLLGLIAIFIVQLDQGAEVIAHPGDSGAVNTIAVLVIICFLVGIARAWELIGGPSIGMTQEVTALVSGRAQPASDPQRVHDPRPASDPQRASDPQPARAAPAADEAAGAADEEDPLS